MPFLPDELLLEELELLELLDELEDELLEEFDELEDEVPEVEPVLAAAGVSGWKWLVRTSPPAMAVAEIRP